MKIRVVIFFLYILFQPRAICQHEIGIKPLGGFLVAHHTEMQYLVQQHVAGLELYYEKPTNGNKKWQIAYRNPEIGYTFFMGSLGNNKESGWATAIVPYVKFHPIKRTFFQFNIKSGMGVAYLSERFDRIENNKNVAIGSSINIAFSIAFEPEIKLKRFDIGLGLSFIHFSNGAYKVPNLGFNIPSAHINIGYRFLNSAKIPVKNELDKISANSEWKKWTFQLGFYLGIKETLPAGEKKFGVYCLAAMANYRQSEKSSFIFSSESYINNAYKVSLEELYKTEISTTQAMRAGFAVGYGLNLGRLLIYLQNGVYAYSKYPEKDGLLFHRLGARYLFDNGIIFHFGLKTHFAKADNFELGIGYTWGKSH